ncbi:MAG: flagellar basal body protein FliL [Acidiphilium sp. 37-64-53]|uniref:flagellar basal body-associated FliL family protein n=1 Tax=Acidiphilium TaxID=522 RepID=UPI000BDDDB91|nr:MULTISPECIES: flagellar basal body-associated FliL family protein [Acidiphilium]OYW02397.1 MAG: flagellar basal body protein FliL [Acidiphilium sp. 37-64-53]OZB30201.1 MAG: flagellar basal body protein FliL [Acidiphilium sp. 34-64-41]HQT84541.1 flagellar basal body-associated FliL family protein [Acidiphilium rubrum]
MAKPPTSAKPKEPESGATGEADAAPAPKKRSKLLLFGILAAVLLLIGGGLWFSGIIPHLLHGHKPAVATGPVFIKIPEIVANLNVPSGQDSYAKLEATLELSSKASVSQVQHDMPRIIDVFQTYLRAMHPSELRGASGTYRLREALIDRVRIAVAPNVVRNVLFEELIVQ